MRLLFLSPRQGWPPLSGAKLREYHFCRALGRQAEVTYVYFAQADQPVPTREDLPFCHQILPVPAPQFYTPVKLAKGLLGRWPLPVVNYTTPQMAAAIEQVTAGKSFDLVHLDSIHLAGYVAQLERNLRPLRVVLNWHNIESEAMRSHSLTMKASSRLYAQITAGRLESTERWALARAFGHVVCSERERQQLLQIAPEARIQVVDNGVATAQFSSAAPAPVRTRIVFVGAMSYYPNIEAGLNFARQVWPGIHSRFPEFRFSIVGSNPPPQLRALAELPGVEVTGTVPDVRPYYRDALAAVVPLRSGGGTRLKILEAMAAGVPVISTALGAEGLEVKAGRDFLLAEQDQEWLPALVKLSEDSNLWRSMSTEGLEMVRRRYDWDVLGDSLVKTYQDWLRP